ALTAAILDRAAPAAVVAIDPSAEYVSFAAKELLDPRVRITVGDATALPEGEPFDVVASGLVLNFIPAPEGAVRAMSRGTRQGGLIAAYVWDYAEGMGLIRQFWDAAVALDPQAG